MAKVKTYYFFSKSYRRRWPVVQFLNIHLLTCHLISVIYEVIKNFFLPKCSIPLALNRHGLKSFLALMFSKTTYATLAGVNDTLIFFVFVFH